MTALSPLLAGLARGLRWMRRVIARIHGSLIRSASTISVRLREQWQSDSGYRRTLIAALSAITATALPHPAIAAALGATLAQRSTRSLHPAFPTRRFDHDLEDAFDHDLDPDPEDDDIQSPLVRDPWRPSPSKSWRDLD